MHRIVSVGTDCAPWWCGRNLFNTVKSPNFLDEIYFAFEVHAESWDAKGQGLRRCGLRANGTRFASDCLQAEPAQKKLHLLGRQFDAEELSDLLRPEHDLPRFYRLGISIDRTLGQLTASRLQNQLCGSLAGPVAGSDVRAALETIRGLSAQAKSFGSGADILWFEIGALDQDIHTIEVDLAVLPPHDAGQRDGFVLIRDQEHLTGERPLLPVKRDKLLAFTRPANDDGGA